MGDFLRRREMLKTVGGSGVTPLYEWNFKTSLVDKIQSVVAGKDQYSTIDSSGIYLSSINQYILLPNVYAKDRTFWLSFSDFDTRLSGTRGDNGRIICASADSNTYSNGSGFIFRNNNTMSFYLKNNSGWDTSSVSSVGQFDFFENSTLKMYVDSNGIATVYKNNNLIISATKAITDKTAVSIVIGGSSGDAAAYLRCTGAKVYSGFYIG